MSKEPMMCMREIVAACVNAPDLSPGGRAVDVLGALGAATHNRYFDASAGIVKARLTPQGTAEINPRRRMASLLERAKYGMDRSSVQPAIYLFVDWLRLRSEYARWGFDGADTLIVRFSERVLLEWLHDRCAQCGGGGQVAIGAAVGRNTRTKTCSLCHGEGSARVDHTGRAQKLGISRAIYEKHWPDRFAQAHGWLQAIEESNITPLRSQLQRGTLPSN